MTNTEGKHSEKHPEKHSQIEEKSEVCLLEGETIGAVQIADDVVAMIALLAAMEVNGVSAPAANITDELISWVGIRNLAKGAKVDVLEGNVTAELVLAVEYGFNIPATCKKVQNKVKSAVENMTGLTCTDVHIRIVGVNMQNGKRKAKVLKAGT
jgi:uncharacterized alkaline shock family protein YloU